MSTLTVVIPTYNSGKTLPKCLSSLNAQTRRPDDLVVVDDVRTHDDTRQIAEFFGARLIVSEAGMSESRNLGFAKYPNDYLVSIDSDMCLSPGLIHDLMARLDNGADALTIREIGIGNGYWARGRALDKEAVELTSYGVAVRAFKRTLFQEVGGYDATLEAGEDLDLHQRMKVAGARILHVDTSYIEHDEGNLRLRDAARKKFRYGQTMRNFQAKHGNSLTQGWSKRLSQAIAIGVRKDPFAVPAFLMLKLTETAAALLGRSLRTPSQT